MNESIKYIGTRQYYQAIKCNERLIEIYSMEKMKNVMLSKKVQKITYFMTSFT